MTFLLLLKLPITAAGRENQVGSGRLTFCRHLEGGVSDHAPGDAGDLGEGCT